MAKKQKLSLSKGQVMSDSSQKLLSVLFHRRTVVNGVAYPKGEAVDIEKELALDVIERGIATQTFLG